jgi:hypothetical protein
MNIDSSLASKLAELAAAWQHLPEGHYLPIYVKRDGELLLAIQGASTFDSPAAAQQASLYDSIYYDGEPELPAYLLTMIDDALRVVDATTLDVVSSVVRTAPAPQLSSVDAPAEAAACEASCRPEISEAPEL